VKSNKGQELSSLFLHLATVF